MDRKSANRLTVVLLLSISVVATARPARAQAPATNAGFALDRFEPSGGGSDWFMLESLDLRGHGRFSAGLVADWALRPLVAYDDQGNEIRPVVNQQGFAHLGLAINAFHRLRLGASLPVALYQQGNDVRINSVDFGKPTGAGVGDLRATADVGLFGKPGGPLRLALGAHVFVPSGKRENYTGDGKLRASPRLLLAGDIGLLSWAARAAFRYRPELDPSLLQSVALGSEIEAGLAAGVRVAPGVLIGLEAVGASGVASGRFGESRASPQELIAGAHFVTMKDWHIGLGVATGLTNAVGTPRVRGLLSLAYFPAVVLAPDRDGDGVFDIADVCPDAPGPRRRDPRTNGCPDRDRDRIIDKQDACPNVPGPRTDDPKTNGCPPPKDWDSDGVMDDEDACPDAPGQKTDDPKTNGCPPDRDQDGILDQDDACPDAPGQKTDDPKTNGCADKDGDGIFDPLDACPDTSGPPDPDPQKNGCPIARVEAGQIKITQQVKFKVNSAEILPESDVILSAVAKILEATPEIKQVRVEGHTDNRGGKAYNQKLSRRRAASVLRWLTGHGIEAARLTSQGFGIIRPIADNTTAEGRQENRRVEFHITDPP